MRAPRVAVIAYPHLYTTVIARVLRAHTEYVIETPDVLADDCSPGDGYDAVVASLPVPREWARVVIQLPDDFTRPVSVSVGDLTLEVDVDDQHPLEDVLRLLDLALTGQPGDVIRAVRSAGSARCVVVRPGPDAGKEAFFSR